MATPSSADPPTSSIVRRRNVHALGSVADRKQADRIEKIAAELAANSSAPEWLKKAMVAAAPAIKGAIGLINVASPFIVSGVMVAHKFYSGLSSTMATALYGITLSFFGGAFPVAIAAAETFRVSGGDRVYACIQDLQEDYRLLAEANAHDDKKDEDNDGVADVDQIDSKALVSRKIHLFMTTVNPDRILQAIGGLTQACAGVLAVVKLQFAKTIALAVSISDNIQKPAATIVTPILAAALPPCYHQWINPLVNTGCKLFAMSLAWYLSRILSSVHSAMLGGLMAGRAIIKLANDQGWLKINTDESLIDEGLGWVLTAGGIYFQFSNGMSLPFPLSIVLFPLSIIEYILEWVITFK